MLVSGATYLYIDTDLLQYYVQASELIDLGVWSPMVVYSRLQVVDYDGILYVALRGTTATPPSQPISEDWSMLVLVRGSSTVISAGSDWIARQMALAALQVGWSGTYIATVAYEIGTSALYYAGSAYSIAIDGTNAAAAAQATADAAFTIAVQGTDLAMTAYIIAQEGTNTGTAALNIASAAFDIAVTGTNRAEQAYSLAAIGTNTGTFALNVASAAFDIAVSGTNRAEQAYSLAAIGTNTGTAALNIASAAFDIAVTGTNLAYVALQTAWVGTVIPPLYSLPDVSIPTPFVNQVLAFDGSLWVAKDTPSQVAPGAFTLYLEDTASGTGGYFNLRTTPSGLAEDQDNVTVGGGTPFVYSEGYLTGIINRTVLDGGIWEFNTYSAVSNGAQSAQIIVETYLAALNGSETLLFAGTSAPVSSTSVTLSTLIIAQGTFATNLTDKLLVKYYWLKNGNPSLTATMWHSGSDHASHIHTPIGFSHNDLGGLQGGATDQYYHTTLDQQGALRGTSGYPSDTNRYATGEDYRLALATVGTTTADAALLLASQGTNLAMTAYIIAQYGTNTGTYALNVAQEAFALASAPFPDLSNRLVSGGVAVWGTGYTFSVVPTVVNFNGSVINYSGTTFTLETADPTDDRIDLVIADINGSIFPATGTPSTPPAPPDYDPQSQFQLTFIPVDANTTSYLQAERVWIYQENLEWTWATNSAIHLNPNSITDPYAGTKAIEGTGVVNGNYFQLTAPTQFDLSNYDTLYFYIKPKASWSTRYLRLEWRVSSGGIRVGNYVSLANGALGFDSSNLNYQLIAIPMRLFGVPVGTLLQTLRFTEISTASSIGFFLDDMALQVGVVQPGVSIPDATTVSKGIVELAQNGESAAAVVVQGNDYRLALGAAGTSAVIIEQGTRSQEDQFLQNQIVVEQGTRSQEDQFLQNQIGGITDILGKGFSGTFDLYLGQVYAGAADTKLVFVNGVVTSQIAPYYSWSDAMHYADGSISSLDDHSGWSANGTISIDSVSGTRILTEDFMDSYTVGTVNSAGGTLTGGTGWGGPAFIATSFIHVYGSETFETYTVGTVIGTGASGTLNGGIGWDGTIVIWTY